MNHDRRLSDVLHVLLHLGHDNAPLTSDALAKALGTNAAVLRRTMAGLRDAGYVRSEKGHGGGWTLARSLEEISLLDVYEALGQPNLFAIGSRSDRPSCLIERNVTMCLSDTMAKARALFIQRFGEVTLDQLMPDGAEPHTRSAKRKI
jgi:Rrf2 family protein